MNSNKKIITSAEALLDVVCGIVIVVVMYVGLFLARLGRMSPIIISIAIVCTVIAFQIWNILAAVSVALAILMAGVCFAIRCKPYYRRTRSDRVQQVQAMILLANALVALIIAILFDHVL